MTENNTVFETMGETLMCAKRTDPWIPVGHPKFVWTSGADVQRTWKKYGWTPPSAKRTPPPVVEEKVPEWAKKSVRRVK